MRAYAVTLLCGQLGVSTQAYYKHEDTQMRKLAEEAFVVEFIKRIRERDRGIGGSKLWRMYKKEFGEEHAVGYNRFYDIVDKYGLKVRKRRRRAKTTDSNHDYPTYPNLVKNMIPVRPNQLWVSDITYIETEAGFVYLHLVTDAYSKKILGWRLSQSLHADATISALQMAIRNAGCDLKGLIHHSDRGCQYCCEKYVKLLQNNGIEISMTQDGDPRDNAIAERLNGILKTEWLYDDHFIGFDDAYRRVAEVINLYNNKRPHLSLNYKTPAEAHLETGEQKRVWKNYYKGNNPEEVAKVISDLTSGCRISAAY